MRYHLNENVVSYQIVISQNTLHNKFEAIEKAINQRLRRQMDKPGKVQT